MSYPAGRLDYSAPPVYPGPLSALNPGSSSNTQTETADHDKQSESDETDNVPELPEWIDSPAAQRDMTKELSWQWKYRWLIRSGVLLTTYGIVVGIGRSAWEWGSGRSFLLEHDGWFEKDHTLDGGADKFGHLYGMYLLSRGITYIFNETHCPHWLSVLMGALNSTLIGVIIEVGDAYTAAYGFSYTDIVFNLIGTAFAVIQDTIPVMDRLFSLSMWWFPSRGYLFSHDKKQELFTDYSGTKYFLHLLLSGIPYINRTALRYFRFDVGFWSRNYKPYDFGYPDDLQQFLYFGMSVDFAQLVLDLWPDRWYRTSTSVFLRYFNLHGPFETGYKIRF